MKSNWEINSAIIREQYPGLLEELLKNDNDPDTDELNIAYTASGLPTALIKGLYVHSPRFPEREGKRLAETCFAESADGATPVIVLGFGLGYAAEAAAAASTDAETETKTPIHRPIIIVEKRTALLRKAFELRDLSRLLSRPGVVFVPGGTGEGVITALAFFEQGGKNTGAENRCRPVVMRNRTLTGIDEQWYASVENRIRIWTTRDDVNFATLKKFGKRWVRNLSRNMTAIRDLPGITRLAGLAASSAAKDNPLPVFLAAAGPGLDRIAPLLPEIRKRCIIVAVDTSLRFLLRNGAIPDFALVVDPQFWNSRHLDRCASPHTRLIAESAAYPPVLRLPFKGVYLCGSQYPLGVFLEQRVDPKGNLGAGGSVATNAWDFSRSLGAREIWIAGLDLSFPGLKTHFHGAQFEEKAFVESGRLNPAETWKFHALRDGSPFNAPALNGGQVLTDRRLSLYAAWFENRFRQFPAIRNYSLSDDGLAITGLEPVQPETLLDLPARREEIDLTLEAVCAHIASDFFEPENARQRSARYDQAVAELFSGLGLIQEACAKGIGIAEQTLRESSGRKTQQETLAALDAVNRFITGSEVKEIAGFLLPRELLAEMAGAEHSPDKASAFNAYLQSALRLYRSLAEAAQNAAQAAAR